MKGLNLVSFFVSILVIFVAFVIIVALFFSGAKDSTDIRMSEVSVSHESYNILLLGRDKVAGLCDVITLASVDMKKGEVNIMQIPRDTYFNYGNGDHNKINGAPCVLSVSKFANELASALGISIDYYLCIDLDTLQAMVDMISGIEIDIPVDMDYDDPSQGLSIHLEKGKNLLNGKEALGFLRYRAGYATGDIGRLDAQKLFLNAFFARLSEHNDPILFYNLFRLLSKNCETNIREQDILSKGIKLGGKRDMKVFYMTAPGEAVQSEKSGAWYYILSSSSVGELLNERFSSAEKDFDKDNKFVDKLVKSFYDIYEKRCEVKIYSANDIENNLININ